MITEFRQRLADTTTREVVSAVLLGLILVVVLLFVVASVPQLAGADESYVVLSDSMSPAIEAGAVVFVSDVPADRIQSGDVITYRTGSGDATTPVTHRVVDVNEQEGGHSFVTRGDANEDPDPSPVPESGVIGQVSFHIPLIGYVVSFASSPAGIVTLVVIPAVLLVVLEVRDLLSESEDEEGSLE